MRYFVWTILVLTATVVLLLLALLSFAFVNAVRTAWRYGDVTMMALRTQQLRDFYTQVEAYFREKQQPIKIWNGVVQLKLDGIDGREGMEELGLQNLAQQCAQTHPTEWPALIAAHFHAIERSHDDAKKILEHVDDYEQVKSLLAVRIMPRYDLPLDTMVHREDLPGTITTLVFDLPTSLRAVQVDEERRWPVGLSQVWKDALENTKRLTEIQINDADLGDGITMKAISPAGIGNYATTHALLLDEHPTWIGAHGSLIAIPNRSALLVYPIHDITVVTALQKLIFIAAGLEKEGPGSITANIYWYRPGDRTFKQLPYELKGKSLNFLPPDEFVEMLNQLSPAEEPLQSQAPTISPTDSTTGGA